MRLIHYTNLDGLVGILQSQKLRLTDAQYLNDSSEIREGIKCLYDALDRLAFSSDINPEFERAYKGVFTQVENYDHFSSELEPVYLCSFSEAPDLLSQWRSYGMFAIEFDYVALQQDGFNLRSCIYDSESKEKISTQECASVIKYALNPLSSGTINQLVLDRISELTELSAVFKNSAFSEEKEIRHVESMENDSLEVKFRTDGIQIKPYIEKPFSIESIKAIHIGPIERREAVQQAIRRLLAQLHREACCNIETEVEIIQSEIPYRS
ncbi:hypothetical protein AWR38_06375 [Idiomarina sp. WRN-38]|nr:hypothetical protein AUR68_06360 [Idiomarina sp. H105]OAE91042.1 hypothetical protein AWR38_06375 [Idiomarina sp. WRN-38]